MATLSPCIRNSVARRSPVTDVIRRLSSCMKWHASSPNPPWLCFHGDRHEIVDRRQALLASFPYGNITFLNNFYELCKTGGMKFVYRQTSIPLNFKMPYSKKFRSRDFFCYHVTLESGRKSENSSFPAFFSYEDDEFPNFFFMNTLPRNYGKNNRKIFFFQLEVWNFFSKKCSHMGTLDGLRLTSNKCVLVGKGVGSPQAHCTTQ